MSWTHQTEQQPSPVSAHLYLLRLQGSLFLPAERRNCAVWHTFMSFYLFIYHFWSLSTCVICIAALLQGEEPAVRMDKSALLLLLCCLFMSSSGSPLYPSIRWVHTRGLKSFTLSLLAACFYIYIYIIFHSRLFQSTTQLWIPGKIVNW